MSEPKKKKETAKGQRAHKRAPRKESAAESGEISSVPVYDSKGKEVERFQLDKKLFTGEVNTKVLYQAVLMYNANQRQGNASTKTRGDVSGGGKKPWRQKGTGRARAGSTRSPLWRGGGVIFGPHPRDFHYDIPQKIKKAAFLSSINSKLNDNRLVGVDSINIDEPKTKKFTAILDALKLTGTKLVVVDKMDEKTRLASRNLPDVVVRECRDFSAMDVLKCDNLVMTKLALEKLPERV